MKTILSLVISIFLLGSLNSAHAQTPAPLTFVNDGLKANLSWKKGPIVNDESILEIDFINAKTGQAADLQSTLSVTPIMQMGSMQHGTAPVTIEPMLDAKGNALPGKYLVSKIYFVMGGTWLVQVKLTEADRTSETEVEKVMVSGGGM